MAKTKVFTQTSPLPLVLMAQRATQLDAVSATGIYIVSSPAEGRPNGLPVGSASSAILLVFSPNQRFTIQILLRAAGPEMYMRNRMDDTWTEWAKVQMNLDL